MPDFGALWLLGDQSSRLGELLGKDPESKDVPLRRDVRSLGILLGQVIKEQCGDALFNTVEILRELLIRHRQGGERRDAETHELLFKAQRLVATLNLAEAYHLTKAFAIYFELTNLAETNHRKRRRRALQLDLQREPQGGTLRGTLLRMRSAGIGAQQALAAMGRIRVMPVFTAHPTEVARRTVLSMRRRIAQQLAAMDIVPVTGAEASQRAQAIAAQITALWHTDEVRRRQPTVGDEIRMGLNAYKLWKSCRMCSNKSRATFAKFMAATSDRRCYPEACDSDRGLVATAMATHTSRLRAPVKRSFLPEN